MSETMLIEWNEQEVEITIGKLNMGDLKRIVEKCGKMKSDGKGGMDFDVEDVTAYLDELFKRSIKRAPFEITSANIDKISTESGMKIIEAIKRISPLV